MQKAYQEFVRGALLFRGYKNVPRFSDTPARFNSATPLAGNRLSLKINLPTAR